MSPQEILRQRYGNSSDAFEHEWMVTWNIREDFPWFPQRTIYVHKDFMNKLKTAFTNLENANLHNEINHFDGCFNIRFIRGSESVYSIHSWGCAIDLNASENPLGSTGNWSRDFLSTMESSGIFCGANWVGRKDPMHFALVNG